MYYTQEQIDRANQADLISFLQSQGEQLTRAGNEYRWKQHDSLTIRGNKWYRHSQSKGGGPVDFVMEFFGKSFTEAVELLTGEKGAAPPPDRPSLAPPSCEERLAVLKEFHNSLLAGYQVIMSGDTNTLYKMKDLWTFLSRSFESPDKYVKKIRKATDVSDYKLAVNALFRECALKSENS